MEVISHWHPNITINIVDDHTPWVKGSVPPPLDQCKPSPGQLAGRGLQRVLGSISCPLASPWEAFLGVRPSWAPSPGGSPLSSHSHTPGDPGLAAGCQSSLQQAFSTQAFPKTTPLPASAAEAEC